MDRQISFQQYRTIDLTILAAILAAVQLLIFLASNFWYADELYVVSPVAAVTALIMMRWNGFGAIHAVLGGVVYTMLAGGTWQHHLIYGTGNLLSLLALVIFKVFGKERIRQDVVLSLVFALSVQLLMLLGRAGVAALLGYSAAASLGFITTDILSGLFTLIVIWIVRRIDGLFEDQKHYLLRIQSGQKTEGREQL